MSKSIPKSKLHLFTVKRIDQYLTFPKPYRHRYSVNAGIFSSHIHRSRVTQCTRAPNLRISPKPLANHHTITDKTMSHELNKRPPWPEPQQQPPCLSPCLSTTQASNAEPSRRRHSAITPPTKYQNSVPKSEHR